MSDPTADEIGIAVDVLLWLFEHTTDGAVRDEISRVRHRVDDIGWEGTTDE